LLRIEVGEQGFWRRSGHGTRLAAAPHPRLTRPLPCARGPFDSHPTIEVRLKALGIDEQATPNPAPPSTDDAAVRLFGDAEDLERFLNARYERDMRAQAARLAAAPLPVHHWAVRYFEVMLTSFEKGPSRPLNAVTR
jgi:hypothetical protein